MPGSLPGMEIEMGKEYTALHTIRIAGAPDLTPFERTAQTVHLSRSCERVGLRGVPLRRIDILIDTRIPHDLRPDAVIVAAIGEKAGRYDGAIRPRIKIRAMRPAQGMRFQLGVLDIEDTGEAWNVTLRSADAPASIEWSSSFGRLRSDMNDYDPARLIMWHWSRYYKIPIPHEDATALAESHVIEASTLAGANREASRALYRLARDLGWRKLTQRERDRLGLVCGQWVSEPVYAQAQADYGHGGCGEATIRAAHAGGTLQPENLVQRR